MGKPGPLSKVVGSIVSEAICRHKPEQEVRLASYCDALESEARTTRRRPARVNGQGGHVRALDIATGRPWALVVAAALLSLGEGPSYAQLYLRLLRRSDAKDRVLYIADLTTLFQEVPMRLTPLVGLPRTINVLTELSKVVPSDPEVKKRIKAAPRDLQDTPEDLERRGRQRFEKIYGTFTEPVLQHLNRIYPRFDKYTLAIPYGLHLAHPGPFSTASPADRETSFGLGLDSEQEIGQLTSILVLSALVAQGQAGKQIESHAYGFENVGLEPSMAEWVCVTSAQVRSLVQRHAPSIPARL